MRAKGDPSFKAFPEMFSECVDGVREPAKLVPAFYIYAGLEIPARQRMGGLFHRQNRPGDSSHEWQPEKSRPDQHQNREHQRRDLNQKSSELDRVGREQQDWDVFD
jgi:hypothetical protein